MAEETSESWGQWFQGISNKSRETWNLVKHDLAEFSETVTKETSQALAKTSANLDGSITSPNAGDSSTGGSSSIKNSISHATGNFLSGIKNLLTIPPDDAADVIYGMSGSGYMQTLQLDPATYEQDPKGEPDVSEWSNWLNDHGKKLDSDDMSAIKEAILKTQPPVKTSYHRLVDEGIVSPDHFWKRYFFRVWQAELRNVSTFPDTVIERDIPSNNQTVTTDLPSSAVSLSDDWVDFDSDEPIPEKTLGPCPKCNAEPCSCSPETKPDPESVEDWENFDNGAIIPGEVEDGDDIEPSEQELQLARQAAISKTEETPSKDP